jgi:glycosyltransferase involved in cell wall biosynthesis
MKTKPKILFIGEGVVSDDVRLKLPGNEMAALGLADVDFMTIHNQEEDTKKIIGIRDEPDILVFSRPHALWVMQKCKGIGKPMIVDMDDDFRAIPKHHPGYKAVGLGNPDYLKQLEECIGLGDLVTVTTQELGNRLCHLNAKIKVIPNGWSSRNPLSRWKRNQFRDRFVLGWAGTITHREDFKLCLNAVKFILKKYPKTMIHIGGDVAIYDYFETVPECQKLFTPMLPFNLYPSMVGYWDLLLAPLIDDEFNKAKSNIKIVDAISKGIPWVASNVLPYQGCYGGILCFGEEEWKVALDQLVTDKDLACELVRQGKPMAEEREMGNLVMEWFSAVRSLL